MAKTQVVRMLRHFSGTRDGVEWPEAGGYVELTEPSAQELIDQGWADIDDETEAAVQKAQAVDMVPEGARSSSGRGKSSGS